MGNPRNDPLFRVDNPDHYWAAREYDEFVDELAGKSPGEVFEHCLRKLARAIERSKKHD